MSPFPHVPSQRRVPFVIASANVCSLLPHQEDCSYSKVSGALLLSKVQMLDTMFNDACFDVVGLQEGRGRAKLERTGVHYSMLVAPADATGSYGVQLWVRTSSKLQVVHWHVCGPRLLYAILQHPGKHVRFGVFVGHAPHELAPAQTKDTWWDALDSQLTRARAKYSGLEWYFALDANARVGSIVSPGIGTCNPTRENDNGGRFRTFLLTHEFAAANTFFPAGETWVSSRGTVARIDYVGVPLTVLPQVKQCWVDKSVDLTLGQRDDHFAVAMRVLVPVIENFEQLHSAKMSFRVNKHALADPARCQAFQNDLWSYQAPVHAHVDDHLEALNTFVRRSARRHFGDARDAPRQAWISPETWTIVRQIAPFRRQRHSVRQHERAQLRLAVFSCWHALVFPEPSIWVRVGTAIDACRRMAKARLAVARITLHIARLQAHSRPLVERDRHVFLDAMAAKAQTCAVHGDSRGAYAVIRALAGRELGATSAVYELDGTVTDSKVSLERRWQQHFAKVFNGSVVSKIALREPPRPPSTVPCTLNLGPEALESAIAKLGGNKGVGPDLIPAELLKAGGSAAAVRYSEVSRRIEMNASWPSQWRGGRIVDLYKGKGDRCVCDHSRGLLLADHASKAVTGIIKDACEEQYASHIPRDQHGAVAGRGTDFASHIIHLSIEAAALFNWSICVLFIDLVKAFDRVVRQLVLGWGRIPPADRLPHLLSVGVSEQSAHWLCNYIDARGCVLEQWGVDPKAVELAESLHAGAWLSVGSLDTAVLSLTGGRQGCKLGSLLFNSAYAVALDMLHWELSEAGISLRVHVEGQCFWCPPGGGNPPECAFSTRSVGASSFEEVVDATFVDDEAIVVMASTAALLDVAIDKLLEIVTRIFELMHLEINWSVGKTECLLKYRGHGAVAHRERRRCPEDGRLYLQVPSRPARVHVVDSYKHLGIFTAIGGHGFKDTLHRVASAMSAYAPLSVKVFGSAQIDSAQKVSFMRSLIESKLFFNIHVTVVSARSLKALNTAYMRVVRRIVDHVRFGPSEVTDLQARMLLGVPSVDCILCRGRLKYAGRVMRKRPRSVLALLSLQKKCKCLPWVEQFRADLRTLVDFCPAAAALRGFDADPEAWQNAMQDESAWQKHVDAIFFFESVTDRSYASSDAAGRPKAFVCCDCSKAFADPKALAQHRRIKHGVRSDVRSFISTSTCPTCGVDFHDRLRCLAHLSDPRRPRCWQAFLATNPPRLPDSVVKKLDETDRELRRAAQQSGRTHHIGRVPARRADGRVVGRLA